MQKWVWLGCFCVSLAGAAFANVSVSSPGNGATVQAPAHFVASASSSCSKGVASMGIYTAPYVLAFVANGSSLDTNLNLAPGTYHTMVEEWDYCGSSSSTPVTITVTNAGVQVSSPGSNSTVSSPVHFVASSTSSCGGGVAAMGIYTAPNQLAYTSAGANLDASLNLSPGTYNAVVEEWDNCGSAATRSLTFTVGSGGDPSVQVTTPANNSTVSSPVHYVASSSTTCPQGVAATGIYVNSSWLAYTTGGAALDTNLNLNPGTYNTVVQEWDKCGGVAKTPVNIIVQPGPGKTFYGLQNSAGWTGYGELAPTYNTCTNCSPAVTWSMTQGIQSPSLSGSAMATYVGGTMPYSDALWNNHLIGDFSSQGLPDPNQTLSSTLHNFVYDVYFFGANMEAAQALEFDINQFVGGRSYIFGHECRVASGHQWDIWNNAANVWVPTGMACNPASNSWNHLVIQVQRTSDNRLLYQTITLNGQTATLNKYDSPTASNWNGVTINYQIDGNYKQQPYSIVLDNLNFTYY